MIVVLFDFLSIAHLRQGFSLNLEIAIFDKFDWQAMVILQSLVSAFLPFNPKIISGHGHTDIYMDSWDSNSDPQVCTEDSFMH